MYLALSSDTLKGYSLDHIFRFAKEAEYQGIDLIYDAKNFDSQNSVYINELIEKHGIPVCTVQAPESLNANKLEGIVKFTKEINCKIIIIQPPKLLSFSYAGWLKKEVPKIRKKEDISIALENATGETYLGFIPKHAMNNLNELKQFKHACLNTSRVAEKSEDLIKVYNSLKDFLVHIHLSNIHRNKPYSMPMTGVLPLESLLSKAAQDGFKGAISIKVNPKIIEAGNDEQVKKNLKEIKEFCEKHFK